MAQFGLLTALLLSPVSVRADFTYGDFKYTTTFVTTGSVANITKYIGTGGEVSIPDTINGWRVTTINGFAFWGCADVTGVSIPAGVTSFGAFAFAHCTALNKVFIPAQVTNIGVCAFADCPNLPTIDVSDLNPAYASVYGILYDKASATLIQYPGGATKNYTVPPGVTAIGEGAFYSCTNLASIALPNSIRTIGTNAFYGCSGLTSLQFPSGVTNVASGAASSCSGLTNLALPAGISQLGTGVIQNCPNLVEITIPPGIASLAGVFRYSSLENVIIPNGVTNISGAFTSCGNLKSVTIPDSVTDVGFQAFYNCPSLTNVIFGTNVTSIGQDAFSSCTALSQITLPESITNLVEDTFGGCYALTNISIPKNVNHLGYGIFYACYNLAGVYFYGNAPTNLGSAIFYADSNAVVYYLPGTTGWEATFAGVPTALWLPAMQTSDASFGLQTNQFGFNLQWASGQTVVVEACTNLFNPDWQPVQTNTLPSSGTAYFSDPQWTNYPGRFYRLRSP